jgi:hypothetical protein
MDGALLRAFCLPQRILSEAGGHMGADAGWHGPRKEEGSMSICSYIDDVTWS